MAKVIPLKYRLVFRTLFFAVFAAALFFVPAGTIHFWQAWVYLAISFVPMVLATVYFYRRDPELVERRMLTRETAAEQRRIMRVARALFLILFVLPGLDHRFGWSPRYLLPAPLWLSIFSQSMVLTGYLITFWVMKENSFASSIVQVEAGQRVISTGPYRIVRHPMYFGVLLMMLFTPLALGSIVALPAFALIIPILVVRLRSEEQILARQLTGYSEYAERTRHRLVPFFW